MLVASIKGLKSNTARSTHNYAHSLNPILEKELNNARFDSSLHKRLFEEINVHSLIKTVPMRIALIKFLEKDNSE